MMSASGPKVEDLRDFPALAQLARTLWRGDVGRRRAALLVGAGFSTNADVSSIDVPQPPLWSHLAKEMADRIYPGHPEKAPYDPLRLAEEFKALLGQSALDELVRTRIRDDAWHPGEAHRALLALPWSDVLTTNWDTLLERASADLGSDYEVVRHPSDLAHARAPRIVKLHGTINTTEHFILSEEDFRTYPRRFAPFVNMAREVFIENELCLLGFSGDDPNFLQWSGWVRDELGDRARVMYLVGVLDLEPAKRKLLETRNVTPIDLADLVRSLSGAAKHVEATRLFLAHLAAARPPASYGWRPSAHSAYSFLPRSGEDATRAQRDDAYAASLIDQAAAVWRRDREAYAGWLVCPAEHRSTLQHFAETVPSPTPTRLAQLPQERRSEVLFELAWRHETAFWPVDAALAKMLSDVADPDQPRGLDRTRQLEIAVILLRTARRQDDDHAFERWAGVLERHASHDRDLVAETAYQRALRARGRLDYEALGEAKAPLRAGLDPAWRMRLAALEAEQGNMAAARRLLEEASADLQKRQRADRGSIWVLSRRAWGQWLAQAAHRDEDWAAATTDWSIEFKIAKCDPWDELDRLGSQAANALLSRRESEVAVTPLFELGRYQEGSPARPRGYVANGIAIELDAISEAAGVPIAFRYITLIESTAKDAAQLDFDASGGSIAWHFRLLRSVSDGDDPLIGRYFGRVGLARLPQAVADALSARASDAIAFWRTRLRTGRENGPGTIHDMFAVKRLRVFIEVLSRLTARQDRNRAIASFDLAMDLAADERIAYHQLFEPLGSLVTNAVSAVAPGERSGLVLRGLQFPLRAEKRVEGRFWPNPVDWIGSSRFDRPQGDPAWAARIAELIVAAGAGRPSRDEAVLRLVYLASAGALSPDERQGLSAALWAVQDGGDPPLPGGTSLLTHAFLVVDGPADIDVGRSVRERLYQNGPGNDQQLEAMDAAATDRSSRLRPDANQAQRLFAALSAWRPSVPAKGLRALFDAQTSRRARRLIGQVLARSVVPALPTTALDAAAWTSLLALIDGADVPIAAGALPYFAKGGAAVDPLAIRARVRRALAARQPDRVAGGIMAVLTWIDLAGKGEAPDLPRPLVEQVVTAVETRRDVAFDWLLACCRKLLAAGLLSDEDKETLAVALSDLLVDTAYDQVDPVSAVAVSISLVRRECVRLAHALAVAGSTHVALSAWVKAGVADPLPEVRFALEPDGASGED